MAGSQGLFGPHVELQLNCRVAANLHQDVILGVDWLREWNPKINWHEFTVMFPCMNHGG